MGVERFADPEDARRALWMDAGDPRLVRRVAALWRRSARYVPSIAGTGVTKYRSIEDANEDREAAVRARVARLRRTRSRGQS